MYYKKGDRIYVKALIDLKFQGYNIEEVKDPSGVRIYRERYNEKSMVNEIENIFLTPKELPLIGNITTIEDIDVRRKNRFKIDGSWFPESMITNCIYS